MKKRRPRRSGRRTPPTQARTTSPRSDDPVDADDVGLEDVETDHKRGREASAKTELAKKFDDSIDEFIPNREQRRTVVKRLLEVTRERRFSGPVPHPEHFERYELAAPGAGLRIIGMAEAAQSRAEDRYDKIVANDYKYSMTGICLAAFVLTMFAAIGAVLCLYGQPEIGAGVLVLSGLSAIASKFIDGRKGSPKKGVGKSRSTDE